MTTDELRRQLDRIADAAPGADVPDDTWTRARRSVVRDRLAVAGAALAVVAVAAAGLTWLPDRAGPPVADSSSGALPSRVWTVPSGQELDVEADLAVGPVSVAYLDVADDGDARAIAVLATTGRYLSLVLPSPEEGSSGGDAVSFGFDDQVLSLSPDGRQLAYSVFPGNGSGVAVVDLIDGTVRQVPLDFERGGFVRSLTWSPDGRYLLWWGQPRLAATAAGLIGPDAATSTPLPPENQDGTRGYAVDDDGRVALIDADRTRIWQAGRIIETRPSEVPDTWAVSAQLSGEVLTEIRNPTVTDEAGAAPQTVMHRSSSGPSLMTSFPEALKSWQALGWTADGAAIVQAQVSDSRSIDDDLYRVALLDDGSITSDLLVDLEAGSPPDGLTVATNLPVEELDAPQWADEAWWGIDPSLLIGLGVAAAVAVLLGLRRAWRRRGHVTLRQPIS